MNKFIKLLLFFYAFIYLGSIFAQTKLYSKKVDLEWEVVEEAYQYELEISSEKKVFKFTVAKNNWSGQLTPGMYKMRIRSKDRRQVAGVWSEYIDFNVLLNKPKIETPAANEIIYSLNENSESIVIKSTIVPTAIKYKFEIFKLNSEISYVFESDEPKIDVKLPVAAEYQIRITAIGKKVNSEVSEIFKFTLIGPRLKQSVIKEPESIYVRELEWNEVSFATKYKYLISRIENNKEVTVDTGITNNQKVPFLKEWLGGQYTLKILPLADFRIDGVESKINFVVKSGDRSYLAEQINTLRMSIDRLSGWYFNSSYLVNYVEYKNFHWDDTNSQVTLQALSGTTRIEAGYLNSKKRWGLASSLDRNSIEISNFDKTIFYNYELGIVYRFKMFEAGDFRTTTSFIYKELPDLSTNMNGTSIVNTTLKSYGLKYNLEYWHALTPKWGVQMNSSLIYLLLAKQTSNNEPIIPTFSYQAGLLGSYRFSKNISMLLGYAFRDDNFMFKAKKNTSFINQKDQNQIELKGHYLNLMLEYQL